MLGDGPQQYVVMYGQDEDVWKSELQKLIRLDQFPEGLLSEQDLPEKDNLDGRLTWMNKEL